MHSLLLLSVFEYTEQGADFAVLKFHVIHLGFLLLTKYYSDDQIEKNEMGGVCSTFRGEKRCVQGFGGET
jgi:hypothetical protein